MSFHQNNADPMSGSVYVLGIEGENFELPVCKIGMTTKDPEVRCAEINRSSTGDFVWSVKHAVMVDNCVRLEALAHEELRDFRQRRREIFSLAADDAYCRIRAILERSRIQEIIAPYIPEPANVRVTRGKGRSTIRRNDEAYAQVLLSFADRLRVKARPWGRTASPSFGASDGAEGVQWNIGINRDEKTVSLGVNLEGMKYLDWPITTFVQSEIFHPTLDLVKAKVSRPDEILLCFSRDAWQVTNRPDIIEHHIGGKKFPLSEIDRGLWRALLMEARDCLNPDRDYRSRTKQLVTLRKSGERRLMEVSPHFNASILTAIDLGMSVDDLDQAIDQVMTELRPIYEWVSRITRSR